MVEDNEIGIGCDAPRGDFVHLAFADQGCGARSGKGHDVLGENVQADRRCEPDRFGETRLRIATHARVVAPLGLEMQNDRAGAFRRIARRAFSAAGTQAVSSATGSAS